MKYVLGPRFEEGKDSPGGICFLCTERFDSPESNGCPMLNLRPRPSLDAVQIVFSGRLTTEICARGSQGLVLLG